MNLKKNYTELSRLKTFEERYNYLKLDNAVGESTFGFNRYLNQAFYRSAPWLRVRDLVITRDCACDLGIADRELTDIFVTKDGKRKLVRNSVLIHHMNPITPEDILQCNPDILNPEYLITVSNNTHQAIHYGDISMVSFDVIERSTNDTCPWK